MGEADEHHREEEFVLLVKGEADEHPSEEEFVLPGWQRSTEADGCAFAWQNFLILDSWVVSQPLELSACTHRCVWE